VSLLPKYVNLILAGKKRIEFRRTWACEPVQGVLLYAVAPIQRIVGVSQVSKVVTASPTALWKLAQQYGGGLTRRELYDYFYGKSEGFGIIIKNVVSLPTPLDPGKVIADFRAPQSFRYVNDTEFQRVLQEVTHNKSAR
jgi:predicted transcriptional regulator